MAAAPLHVVSVQTTGEKGGAEYSNVDLMHGLAERGARVKLLTNFPEIAEGTGCRCARSTWGRSCRGARS